MDSTFKHHYHHRHGLSFSLVLILVGLFILAVNTGLLPVVYKPLFSSWPIWLFIASLFCFLGKSFFTGCTLLTVGAFFMIPEIGSINPALNIPPDFTHLYWPVLLIIAGIYFAVSKVFFPGCGHKCHERFQNDNAYTSKWDSEDGFIRVSTSFDSSKNIVLDPVFKGADIECSFGEVTLDLRKTTLQEGKTFVKVSVSFGSVSILVPDGWNVQLLGQAMFGTFTDSRYSRAFNKEDEKVLIIDGKCSFADCKLKD